MSEKENENEYEDKNQTINQITLDCLINKEMYEKIMSSTEAKKYNLKEMKFYRKRIYDLAKRLLISKEERENVSPDVKYAFNNFVKTAISYFKIMDKQDILQKDYEHLIEDDIIVEQTQEETVNYDEFIMKKIKMPEEINKMTTLDSFVIRKETVEEPTTIIYPQKREYNLKDESLKEKGIKKKANKEKKNINNKYENKEKTIQKENEK